MPLPRLLLRCLSGLRLPATALALVVLDGCTAPGTPAPDPARPHHTGQGFRNPGTGTLDKSLSDLLRWKWQAWRAGLPPPPQIPTPVVPADLAQLQANGGARPSVTWIGHATTLVQSGGLNVLTDPMFSERASPVQFAGPRRAQPPGIALADLPPIDVVVVSHSHYDHLDHASIEQLARRGGGRTLFLVPLGLKAWMEARGARPVLELDWWDVHSHRGVEFQLVPVQHWSARSLGDRNQTLWGGWLVLAPGLHWYFSGDTGYSRDFQATRAQLQARRPGATIDLALLAIGGYEPRWFMQMQHMNPAEALQAHRDLGARRSIGIHWGTFPMTDEALDEPPRALARARQAAGLPEAEFTVLKIGETRWLAPREARQSLP